MKTKTQHMLTPLYVDCSGLGEKDFGLEDANHKTILWRGLTQQQAKLIVRAVNSHEALLKSAQKALAALNVYEQGIANEYAEEARIELRHAIAQAEGK